MIHESLNIKVIITQPALEIEQDYLDSEQVSELSVSFIRSELNVRLVDQ